MRLVLLWVTPMEKSLIQQASLKKQKATSIESNVHKLFNNRTHLALMPFEAFKKNNEFH